VRRGGGPRIRARDGEGTGEEHTAPQREPQQGAGGGGARDQEEGRGAGAGRLLGVGCGEGECEGGEELSVEERGCSSARCSGTRSVKCCLAGLRCTTGVPGARAGCTGVPRVCGFRRARGRRRRLQYVPLILTLYLSWGSAGVQTLAFFVLSL